MIQPPMSSHPVRRQSAEPEISSMRGQRPRIVAPVADTQRTSWLREMRAAGPTSRSGFAGWTRNEIRPDLAARINPAIEKRPHRTQREPPCENERHKVAEAGFDIVDKGDSVMPHRHSGAHGLQYRFRCPTGLQSLSTERPVRVGRESYRRWHSGRWAARPQQSQTARAGTLRRAD